MPSVKSITSRDNPLLARLRKLASDPSSYRKLNEVWLEGDHLCSAFLQRGGAPSLAVVTEAAWEQPALRELAQHASNVAIVAQALMNGISTLESPAPIGMVVPWKGAGHVDPQAPSVVLDRLQDAGNVGTILRSASAFGFTQVLAMKGTAALWSPKVLRSAMGAHFALNLVEGVEDVATLRVPMIGTSSHAEGLLHEAALPWPCAWVLGHEGQGMSGPLEAACSLKVRIPQPGGEESLNVGAAAAICLYESARRRL